MRLLAVRLQNLNSLSGAHEVRFDEAPLSAAGVFLITGPTGAGKSTLLDAMTLALYGRAARYGNDKADEMMSRHAAECLAEVDFEARGERLRATWRLRRARGKADGKLQPVERRLARADSGEILAEKAGEMDRLIEEKTGLDCQRFLRSVLLAQGQFAAFLKAKPNERAELLEKITGTEIYRDLSMLAFETHREKDEHARQLKLALGAIAVLDDEARAKLETELAEARLATERLQASQAAAGTQLQAQLEHARIVAELTKLATIAQLFQQAQTEAAAEVSKAKEVFAAARQQRAQREPVWDRAMSLETESQVAETTLKAAQENYRLLLDEKKTVSARREAAEKALAAQHNLAQELEAWLKEHAADAGLADRLPQLRIALREWRVAHETLVEGRKRRAEVQTLQSRLAEAEARAVALRQKAAEETTKTQTARLEREGLAEALEAQRELVRHAERVAGFEEHRHDLKAGKPCPLCGATEHPLTTSAVDAESQLQILRGRLTNLEKQSEQASRALSALERELVKTEAELTAEKKRIEETRKALKEVLVPDVAALEVEEKVKCEALTMPGCSGERASTPPDAERELDALEERVSVFGKKQRQAVQQRSELQKLEGDVQLVKQDEAAKSKRLEELAAEGRGLAEKSKSVKTQLSGLLGGGSAAA